MVTVTVKKNISLQRVQDMVCLALEGGSNYWIESVEVIYPEGHNPEDYASGGKHFVDDLYNNSLYNVWRFPGGALRFKVEIGNSFKKFDLNNDSIQRGFELLSSGEYTHSRIWDAFEKENEDAEVGDCWLQLALFGELIFS